MELNKITESLIKFLNSFVTLLVGAFVIGLYLKQKWDKKRDAASLILQEIRYAEQQVRKYKDFKRYSLSDRLLPTNNWNNNICLFVKDLKETDIDLINAFYAKAAYIDIEITAISNYKNQLEKPLPVAIDSTPKIVKFDPMQKTQ